MDSHSEGSFAVDNSARRLIRKNLRGRRGQLITPQMLPDDVLLEIFDFYVNEDFRLREKQKMEVWITLVHVCRRWRSVVFQSPLRLNLRLVCTPGTRVRDTLDIWPALPLIIQDNGVFYYRTSSVDDIVAALAHNDRVTQIRLGRFPSSQMGSVTDSAAMQKPFPVLTDLELGIDEYGPARILTDSFLGGTAPGLRSFVLFDVPFPGLPKLLPSTTHLVRLSLLHIPRSGYIPPEAMAITLSVLTSLESLELQFRYPCSALAPPSPPPLTRSILPRLTEIRFKGASEYLEEILARVDPPRLNELHIAFFNQAIFDTPQLLRLIARTPMLWGPEKGHIAFNFEALAIKFPSQTSDYDVLSVRILCRALEWQLSSLQQLCTSSLPPLFTLKDLYMFEDPEDPPGFQDDVENTLWLDVLRPFYSVRNLYLSEVFVPLIAPALQELVGVRTTEVLPILENIFLEGLRPSQPLREDIVKFVTARQFRSHPVAVSRWARDLEQERHSEFTY